MSYSKTSISNILKDNMSEHSFVTRDATSVKVSSTGYCKFDYSFDTGKVIGSSLKVVAEVCEIATINGTPNTDVTFFSSRYSTDMYVDLKITYYKGDTSTAGLIQVSRVFPWNKYERNNITIIVPINSELYVKHIELTLGFNLTDDDAFAGTTAAKFTKVNVYKQNTTTEEIQGISGVGSTTLETVTTYTDGCAVKYDNDADPLKLKFIQDGSSNLTAIEVYKESTLVKTIEITQVNSSITI